MTSNDPIHHLPQPLDPLRFPLSGRSLIEASAGTGKTFTIAMLYVRLVLGSPPGQTPAARPLTPPEILVVTFTDAATKELRDRIRARLTEAARYFQAAPQPLKRPPPGQDLLHDLREAYPQAQWPLCAHRLQLAAEWMDEAAVSTIHGWCNRMLREHAFDSGSLFEQKLETDQSDLLAQVVRDYWRIFMAPLDAAQAGAVATWAKGPDELREHVGKLIGVAAQLPLAKTPAEELDERPQRLAAFKLRWQRSAQRMVKLLDAAVRAGRYAPNAFPRATYVRRLDKLKAWALDTGNFDPPALPQASWKDYSPAELRKRCLTGKPLSHGTFHELFALREDLKSIHSGRGRILMHAARWIAARFDAEQARRARMGFDDLLKRLDGALHGPNGPRLAQIIRTQFPVALIDEFQDTDPVQYRIFDAAYGACGDAANALIMIGDPKQAIYAFRGADIYTYLEARRSCGARLFTLAKNFRSTQAMVDAVNACFDLAEQRVAQTGGDGAFMFRGRHGNPVPFARVSAQGRDEAWHVDGGAAPALTVWHLPSADGEPVSKGAYLNDMAAACATEMVRLLECGQQGKAGFASAVGLRELRPADMAVLVNNGDEAKAIRAALGERGVRSVYLSEKESVYASGQAADMAHWLAAFAQPDDGRLVRNALATATLGLPLQELDEIFRDAARWEARVLQFRGYRECWRTQGILPVLRMFLSDHAVPARLLGHGAATMGAPSDGERVLTDLLHLAELLQQASALIEGEQGLIRHLHEERRAARESGVSDVRQIRLESDGDLVKVVTIHKSKGLEYPLVFLPFICAFRPVKLDDTLIKWHDDQGALHVAAQDGGKMLARADDERLGEDLRKLYVALTRAQFATWIGMTPCKDVERSAIGYLLNGRQPLEVGTFESALRAAFGHVKTAPQPASTVYSAAHGVPLGHRALRAQRALDEGWWIASYSSLKAADGVPVREPESRGQANIDEADDEQCEVDDIVAPVDSPANATGGTAIPPGPALPAGVSGRSVSPDALRAMHNFPRGAQQGSFLHDLLDWAAKHGFAKTVADSQPLRDVIARRCSVRGWQAWIEPLHAWVLAIISTPFGLAAGHGRPATSFRLSELKSALGEMEFWFTADRVSTIALDRLVREHTFDGAARPALRYAQLNGMLKGFMDLVFEHEGRYYVADYKSNGLGQDCAHYTDARIRAQMLHSRYDLQMVLYLLALHRLLRSRLPHYDYDVHMGGAAHLFVRGLNGPSQGVCFERPPRVLIEALDSLFTGAENAHVASLENV